jgi:hypothetical protein
MTILRLRTSMQGGEATVSTSVVLKETNKERTGDVVQQTVAIALLVLRIRRVHCFSSNNETERCCDVDRAARHLSASVIDDAGAVCSTAATAALGGTSTRGWVGTELTSLQFHCLNRCPFCQCRHRRKV